MKDNFFLGGGKKRTRKNKHVKEAESEEEEGDVDTMNLEHEKYSSASEDELEETPAQKRLRLAKQYIQKVTEETNGIFTLTRYFRRRNRCEANG
jgi:ribosomal RNA-processing protein 9